MPTDSPPVPLAPPTRGGGHLLSPDLTRSALGRAEVRRLVDSGDLSRAFRGAYLRTGETSTGYDRARARVLAAVDPRRFRDEPPTLTGPAAALVHRLPLIGRPPDEIHVLRHSRHGRARRGLLVPTGWADGVAVVEIDGARCVTPGRAALDTARAMGLADGVAAADAALRRGLCCEQALASASVAIGRAPRIGRARLCVDLADPRSQSPGESWSAVVLHELGLPRPDRQHAVTDSAGFVGRVDFWWPEQQVVGEFDGRVKYGRANPSARAPEDVLWEEKLREDRLRALGLTVVRWTFADLRDPTSLAARLHRAVTR